MTAEGAFAAPPGAILVAPLRVGEPPDLRVLTAADVLARRCGGDGRPAPVALAISHGGVWSLAGAHTARDAAGFLRRRRKHFEKSLQTLHERLGLASDLSSVFSLNATYRRTALRVFSLLVERGCLNRERVIAPWCTYCLTTLDPDRRREVTERSEAVYELLFPLKGTDKKLPVRIADPALLGAVVGLALHPQDQKLAPLIGRTAVLPIYGREVRIIGSSHLTRQGAARPILPAYDETDLALAEEGHLAVIDVLGPNGKLDADAGRFEGLDLQQARESILNELKELKVLTASTIETVRTVACEICASRLSFRLVDEWFVEVASLGVSFDDAWLADHVAPLSFQRLLAAERPRRKWCISRRSSLGVRLPVWSCTSCDEYIVAARMPSRCSACGGMGFSRSTDRLSSGFLASIWPLVAGRWTDDEDEEPFPAAPLLLARDRESELAYLTLLVTGTVSPGLLPRHIVSVGPGQGITVLPDGDGDALRLALLARGEPRESIARIHALLDGLARFVEKSLDGAPVGDACHMSLLDSWAWHVLLKAERVLERHVAGLNVSRLGELLIRTLLEPMAGVYASRAHRSTPEARAFIAREVCARALPVLALVACSRAGAIGRTAAGQDGAIKPPAEPGDPVQAPNQALLAQVNRFLALERVLGTAPVEGTAVRGPRRDVAALREIAAAFSAPGIIAALDAQHRAGLTYGARTCAPFVVLVPGEEDNIASVIEWIKQHGEARRARHSSRQDAADMTELASAVRPFICRSEGAGDDGGV